jgi:hypothetical protein
LLFHGLDVSPDHVELGGLVSGLSDQLLLHHFLIFSKSDVEELKNFLSDSVMISIESFGNFFVSNFGM